MIPAQWAASLPWLLPPVVGAAAGYGLGRLAAGIVARALAAGRLRPGGLSAAIPVDEISARVLETPLSSVVPAAGSPAALSIERAVTDFLERILSSRGVIYAVRDVVSNLVAGIAARGVGEVSRELGLQAVLEEKLLPALVHGDEGQGRISGIIDSYAPEAASALVRWLRSPETRAVLSERGRDLLPRVLATLTELQKFFLGAAQFDRRLDEKMPEIVDETIQAVEKILRDPVQQKRMGALFSDSAHRWLDEPSTRRSVAGRATLRLEEDHRTLGAFFRDVFGVLDTQVVDTVSSWVLGFLTRPESAQEIARRLCSLLLSYARDDAQATLASALGVDAERKRRLDAVLSAAVPRAEKRLAPLLGRRIGEALRANHRFGSLGGLFGAAIGLAVGLVAALVRLVN